MPPDHTWQRLKLMRAPTRPLHSFYRTREQLDERLRRSMETYNPVSRLEILQSRTPQQHFIRKAYAQMPALFTR